MTIQQIGVGVALALLCVAPVHAGDPVEVCGDVNESGSVSATDALLVLKEGVGQPVDLVCPAINALATCQADLASTNADLSACLGDSCGDGVVNAVGEQCDNADLNGADCTSLAYELGTLACNGSCKFDATGCSTCTGALYENTCWFLGASGQSCGQVCASAGLVYDVATRTVAGSDGTDEACETLLDLLDAPGSGLEYPSFACTYAVGCIEEEGLRGRCATPETTSSAKFAEDSRVCACTSNCTGVAYAGACWFLGTAEQSCDTVCANRGLTYNDATAAVAGSGGTDEACETLLDKLGAPGSGLQFPSFDCSFAVGCLEEGGARGRCATPATTSNGAYFEDARACACE